MSHNAAFIDAFVSANSATLKATFFQTFSSAADKSIWPAVKSTYFAALHSTYHTAFVESNSPAHVVSIVTTVKNANFSATL